MRIYEELFIVKSDGSEEEIDGYIEQVKQLITGSGGSIEKVEKWGTRKLAYRVKKYSDGQYVLMQFSAEPGAVRELERRMRVTDLVIKYITVRIDEKLKKIEKRRKIREKRAKRKPAPVAAAPTMPSGPAEPVPGMPGAPAPSAPAAPSATAPGTPEQGTES